MARSKEGRESEYYLGQIRELKAENKSLKQRLKQLSRREHLFEEQELKEIIEKVIVRKETCPGCGKGFLEVNSLVGRTWLSCDNCTYRTKASRVR